MCLKYIQNHPFLTGVVIAFGVLGLGFLLKKMDEEIQEAFNTGQYCGIEYKQESDDGKKCEDELKKD